MFTTWSVLMDWKAILMPLPLLLKEGPPLLPGRRKVRIFNQSSNPNANVYFKLGFSRCSRNRRTRAAETDPPLLSPDQEKAESPFFCKFSDVSGDVTGLRRCVVGSAIHRHSLALLCLFCQQFYSFDTSESSNRGGLQNEKQWLQSRALGSETSSGRLTQSTGF